MAHSSSRVWVSPLEATHDRWATIRNNLSRVRFDRSPFVPQGFQGYVEHLAVQAEDSARAERRRLARLEAEQSRGIGPNHPWIIPFNGRSFRDNRSAVLAMPTVWSIWYEPPPSRPDAPWPTPEEFREEGDERHTSGFGRFLPLPRVPGNETVVWKQKAFLEPYALDYVNPVLWRERGRVLPLEEEGQDEEILAETWMTDTPVDNADSVTAQDVCEFGVANGAEATAWTGFEISEPVGTGDPWPGHRAETHVAQEVEGAGNARQGATSHNQRPRALSRYSPSLEFFPSSRRYNNVELSSTEQDHTAAPGLSRSQEQPRGETEVNLDDGFQYADHDNSAAGEKLRGRVDSAI
ncbi:hypothetical protein MMC13_000657 [Lambiella insularis]|nr:hypothetical protein [Lambiella insularis]